MKRDYLRLSDLSLPETQELFARARMLKEGRRAGRHEVTLAGRHLVCVFEKASTRTRLSFEAAMLGLGGTVTSLGAADSQLARGETIEDTARVVSRYADVIMLRTFGDDRLMAFARTSRVPVINGLSEGGHPVQLLADLLTVEERLGTIAGKRVAFVGDGACNMARSWMEAARLFGFTLTVGAPRGYTPPASELEPLRQHVRVMEGAEEAVAGAHVVVTDTWTSMGHEAEADRRRGALGPYQLNGALLSRASGDAIVLHCLPAHRGEEITDAVIDGPRSAVWDEAENRMHVQKALLEKLLLG
ncbi:MAG: ornithine carbamoyltransferase [Myxococcaceae bacterium]|nr:ornithine carbamoyltransferase [Myxococcaceae bacterium]